MKISEFFMNFFIFSSAKEPGEESADNQKVKSDRDKLSLNTH